MATKEIVVREKKKKTPQEQAAKVQKKFRQLSLGERPAVLEGSAARAALRFSRYLQSVLDPWMVAGAKVPDEITAPSAAFQMITKLILTAVFPGAGNPCGVGVIYRVGSSVDTATFSKCRSLVPASSSSYGTGGGSVGVRQVNPGVPQLAAVAQMARPVSCGISLSFQGASVSDQGRVVVAFLPPGDPSGWINLLQAVDATTLLQASTSSLTAATYSVDLAARKGYIRGVWFPIDAIARSYLCVSTSTLNRPAGSAPNSVEQYGALVVLADGLDSSSLPNVEVTIAENWEFMPTNNATNIVSPTASPSDPLELAAASNVLASNPLTCVTQSPKETAVGTPLVAGMKAGGSVVKTNHPSFLDSVFSLVEKGVEVGKKVAPVAGALLAML